MVKEKIQEDKRVIWLGSTQMSHPDITESCSPGNTSDNSIQPFTDIGHSPPSIAPSENTSIKANIHTLDLV